MVASFSSQVTLSTCGFSCRWPLKRNSTLSYKMCTTTPVSNSKTISPIENEMKKELLRLQPWTTFPALLGLVSEAWLICGSLFISSYWFTYFRGGGVGQRWRLRQYYWPRSAHCATSVYVWLISYHRLSPQVYQQYNTAYLFHILHGVLRTCQKW